MADTAFGKMITFLRGRKHVRGSQFRYACLGASLMALAQSCIVNAAEAPVPPPSGTDNAFTLDEIVVTARRKFESLQDVPLVVEALTAETLNKVNVTNLSDIQKVVPGLTMTQGVNGLGAAASMRGVNYDLVASGNNGTVEFYLNDAPISSNIIFASMYDVQQVEVLRGPQGTLRGRASPSGSITIATHKPDLAEYGGYVNLTATTGDSYNGHGGLNIPLIEDKLAVRVAGVYDDNDANEVTSLNSSIKPKSRTESGRISLRAEPADFLELNASYQRLENHTINFIQNESFNVVSSTAAASPIAISADDHLAIYDAPYDIEQKNDIFNWQASAVFAEQRLSYVGSWMKQRLDNSENYDYANFFDGKNTLGMTNAAVGDLTFGQTVAARQKNESHEFRLQNEERILDMFDYVAGYFSRTSDAPTTVVRSTALVVGVYPVTTGTAFINGGSRLVPTTIVRTSANKEASFFGNLTAHFGEGTELAGGLRRIKYEEQATMNVGGTLIPFANRDEDFTKTIFSGSLKHRFNSDFMAYASVASSWRPGVFVVGDFNLAPSALEQSFVKLAPETSKSYEIGFKSDLLDRRLTFNASAYRQDFTNYPYRVAGDGVYFINTSNVGTATAPRLAQSVAQFNFAGAVPVRVHGLETELVYRPAENWFLAGTLNYAKGEIRDGTIPCNDLNKDGVPDANLTSAPTLAQLQAAVGANNVAACKVSYRSSFAAPFSGTLQSEYSQGIGNFDGFVRGLVTWKGKSKNDPTNSYDEVGSYALLDVYLGLRDPDSAWEVSLFAKNLTKNDTVLTRSNGPLATSYTLLKSTTAGVPFGTQSSVANSTYTSVTTVQPRVFGINLRYAFGSR